MEPVFRHTGRPAAPRPTWGAVVVAVLFGTVVAAALLLPALYLLDLLHLLPGEGVTKEISPGPGWPWPLHSRWAALADAGPMIGAAAVMALLVRRELQRRSGGELLLLPVIATAIGVGWLPVPRPHGIVDVPFPLAFAAVVVVVRVCWRRTPLVPPGLATASRRVRTRRHRRPGARAAATLGALGLAGASITYHALNPIRIEAGKRNGKSAVTLRITNDGPARARLEWVRPSDPTGVALVRVDVPTGRIAAGDSQTATAAIALANCAPHFAVRLTTLAVRTRTRWATRTLRVRLSSPLRLTCRARP